MGKKKRTEIGGGVSKSPERGNLFIILRGGWIPGEQVRQSVLTLRVWGQDDGPFKDKTAYVAECSRGRNIGGDPATARVCIMREIGWVKQSVTSRFLRHRDR